MGCSYSSDPIDFGEAPVSPPGMSLLLNQAALIGQSLAMSARTLDEPSVISRPSVVSSDFDAAFVHQARAMHLDPDSQWVGGYVESSWEVLGPIFAAMGIDLRGLEVLEFGCNVGGSAIVCAQLGARVHGVDIAPDWVNLASLNAARYGHPAIDLRWVPDSRALPYAAGQFDLIICNSVLEYVDANLLRGVQRSVDRVLKPGGIVLVSSTSSRLWPREVHGRRWGVNYLPTAFDRLLGISLQRGVWPWAVRYGFGVKYRNLDRCGRGSLYLRSKCENGRMSGGFVFFRYLSQLLGVPPGLLAPNVFCVLRKP
jgi:2-polyprenyl-3-methyl-5-hydroxy-6-metoxy-1,4-benzoquinol methylase